MVLCALAALKEAGPQLDLGIAFVGTSHPVFRWDRDIDVHPYVLHEDELKKYQGVIDLYNIEAWTDQVYKPFDFEAEFLKALDIPPANASTAWAGRHAIPRDWRSSCSRRPPTQFAGFRRKRPRPWHAQRRIMARSKSF